MARDAVRVPDIYRYIEGWPRDPELIARNLAVLNWCAAGYCPFRIAGIYGISADEVARIIYHGHGAGDELAARRARRGKVRP